MFTVLAWGGADLFYKKGTDESDKYSHVKIAVMVGAVMGVHATVYLLVNSVQVTFTDLLKYSPVSLMYIISMVVGYVGLRYLDLSVSSPVQNTSGVIVTILMVIFFQHSLTPVEIIGILLITGGVIFLAVLDKKKVDLSIGENRKYSISFFAILFPILYCFIDGAGTFADAIYLDEMELISEDAALVAYEYTFLIAAVICRIILAVKKVPFKFFKERDKGLAAVLETAGQYFYVYAMSSNAIIAAPLVATYAVFSVIFSRIFLKEKLKGKQYAVIAIVMAGIALLGIAEALAE